jgi:SAM-dependent methyltransferase
VSFGTKLAGFKSVLRERSPGEILAGLSHRLSDEFQERRLGIRTRGFLSGSELGHVTSEFGAYLAAPYAALWWGLDRIPVTQDGDAFLDIGSGMGRVIVVAGTRRFRRVIGVEISPGLAERARENIASAGKRLRSPVDILVADACEYQVPDDITVVHLFNPFGGSILTRVVQNIRDSLTRRPRRLSIIYGNPKEFERMRLGKGWTTRGASRVFYPKIEYTLYHCSAAG